MRLNLLAALLLGAFASSASALTVDELVAKNIEARGGLDAIRAIKSIKSTGTMNFSGGDFSLDLGFVSMNERDSKVRTEASIQGLSQVTAYDGKDAWTINPFQGRRDPERMSAEDAKGLEVQADMDGPGAGKMEGRAIDTIGYRGMHSYEIALEDWFVPAENLIGMEGGMGRGFYYQMAGFENGRLQTAARAIGVMQAAYEAARDYAENRKVFGANISEYQLTQVKLARMAVLIQAARQFAYEVARMMARGEGALEASLIKAYVCKAAEWVTREAMQIHGGMGYAEEYDVSRYFVDARVLSIFEGADETLCLKVIARRLVENHQKG